MSRLSCVFFWYFSLSSVNKFYLSVCELRFSTNYVSWHCLRDRNKKVALYLNCIMHFYCQMETCTGACEHARGYLAVWIYPLNLIRMKIWEIVCDGVLPFQLLHSFYTQYQKYPELYCSVGVISFISCYWALNEVKPNWNHVKLSHQFTSFYKIWFQKNNFSRPHVDPRKISKLFMETNGDLNN